MTTIPRTRLSTHLVGGEIDIENAFKLFGAGMTGKPATGVTAAWPSAWGPSLTIGPLRVNLDCTVTWSAGILGPGVGVCVDLEGTADGNTASFTASNSKMAAGLEIGLIATLYLSLELQAWTLRFEWVGHHWHKHLKVTAKWVNVAGLTVNFPIDLSAILIDYFLTDSGGNGSKEGQGTPPKKLPQADWQTGTGLSAIDFNSGDLGNKGTAHVEPTWWVMVNLANEVDAPGKMKELHDWLVDAGGDFFFGPTLNLSVPTTVKLTSVMTGGVEYAVDSAQNGALSCTKSGLSSVGAGKLGATFSHHAGMKLGLGLGIGLHVHKIFGFYKSSGAIMDFVSLLGFQPEWGADSAITAAYGATTAQSTLREAIGARYKVILEEPAGLAG